MGQHIRGETTESPGAIFSYNPALDTPRELLGSPCATLAQSSTAAYGDGT